MATPAPASADDFKKARLSTICPSFRSLGWDRAGRGGTTPENRKPQHRVTVAARVDPTNPSTDVKPRGTITMRAFERSTQSHHAHSSAPSSMARSADDHRSHTLGLAAVRVPREEVVPPHVSLPRAV